MVSTSYLTNHDLTHSDRVDLIAIAFTGALRDGWDKHLIEESRNHIKAAVQKDEEGIPIFDERYNRNS